MACYVISGTAFRTINFTRQTRSNQRYDRKGKIHYGMPFLGQKDVSERSQHLSINFWQGP
ncbi:hypothetical protein PAXRUDRAFT_824031 [Paxillus rubicundulus Ve08.2h10]|uniref:Uncharacterized protein n=1 Tax=Paxillus rubicundulus Ve08.2h10 TaxID=930991 RepID=A0A0D0E885_9AGAM|nr:hypothetical protein PAXRUDRAFT_824031 [Paxillus rubicundulus Ve08.2h10]